MIQPLKVLIVDDHQLFAGAMSAWFTSFGDHIETLHAQTCAQATDYVGKYPDISILLIDLNLETEDGVNTYQHLKERFGKRKTILCTGDSPEALYIEDRLLHEVSIVFKSDSLDVFRECFQSVLDGRRYHSPTAAAINRVTKCAVPGLTPRQKIILDLISTGQSNQEIAEQLSLSENTIKTHIRHLYTRLGVSSRSECMEQAEKLRFYLD